jgi:AcrR family transcriptional regulator
MPRAFSDQQKKQIETGLLEQGKKLFSQYGLKKTSIEELAAAVGISKAAFYLFYESKEALFMDVAEQAEQQYRQVMLAMIDQPGETPRARLTAVFKQAFSLWKTIPVLQVFTRGDYERIAQRLPEEKVREHMRSDRDFLDQLVAHCRSAGIPIVIPAEEMSGLMYALFFAVLHEDDLGPSSLTASLQVMLELAAAYCLGEIEISPQRTK